MSTFLKLAAVLFMIASTVIAIQSWAYAFGYASSPGPALSTLLFVVAILAWREGERKS